MTGINQIPTDYKKMIDQTYNFYLPKVKTARTLYSEFNVDSGQITMEYAKSLQTYAEATGWSGMEPSAFLVADGTSPQESSIGTEDATSTILTYGKAFTIQRKLLNSGLEFMKGHVAQHSLQVLNSIENQVNSSLITNMASNAGQSYTASATWDVTSDPVSDIIDAKNTFKKGSGGIDANFVLLHPDDYTFLEKDDRFQSTLYTKSSSLETGEITPKPLGLQFVKDTQVTTGTFFMGAKGMFGKLMISENYKTFQKDQASIGMTYETIFSYVDQYPLPNYLLYATGI